MQHKRLKLSAIFCLGLGLTGLQAQESINASGGNASGSGGSVSYSVGQATYQTHTGTNGSVVEGVQHPYEILVVTAIEEDIGITFRFRLIPTPLPIFLHYVLMNLTF